MNWVAIADVNSIVNPDRLRVGDVLLLPTADELSHYAPPFAGYQRFNPAANHPGPNRGVGRELVVVLSTQSAYAYEDGVLQKAVLVSTGPASHAHRRRQFHHQTQGAPPAHDRSRL